MKKLLFLAALATAATAGCKKDEKKAADTPAPATEQPAAETPPAPEPTPEPAATPTDEAEEAGDYVRVLAKHSPAKPEDPVTVSFESFKVTKANFDPKNLEGGTAEIEIDLSSLSSGIPKRDGHLKTGDYLNVEEFAKAVIGISDVKKAGEMAYTAQAEVSAHGQTKTMPVEFSVTEATDTTVSIKASKEFARTDFGIGKEEGDPTDPSVTIEMALTLTAE